MKVVSKHLSSVRLNYNTVNWKIGIIKREKSRRRSENILLPFSSGSINSSIKFSCPEAARTISMQKRASPSSLGNGHLSISTVGYFWRKERTLIIGDGWSRVWRVSATPLTNIPFIRSRNSNDSSWKFIRLFALLFSPRYTRCKESPDF